MEQIILKAASSGGHRVYDVTFTKADDGRLSVRCTCDAGWTQIGCKHKFALMRGELEFLWDEEQAGELKRATEWVRGSSLLPLWEEVLEAKAAVERARKTEKAIRRQFDYAMWEGL